MSATLQGSQQPNISNDRQLVDAKSPDRVFESQAIERNLGPIMGLEQLSAVDPVRYHIGDNEGLDREPRRQSSRRNFAPDSITRRESDVAQGSHIASDDEQLLGSLDSSAQLHDFEQLKLIRAQTLQNQNIKPIRIACVGVIEPLEETNPASELQGVAESQKETSQTAESELAPNLGWVQIHKGDVESQPAPKLPIDHLNCSASGPTNQTPEVDLMSLRDLIDSTKIIAPKFRPQPGDVIIAAKPKRSSLTLADVITMSMEAKALEFYPSNDRSHLNGLVALYQDSFFFTDEGEYRKSVSDVYEFQQGDIVARLGYFNERWHWFPACNCNFYLYYPTRVEGEYCQNPNEMGPWYLLNNPETSPTGGLEFDPPPKPDHSITPGDLLPFSTLSYPFEPKNGDILFQQTNDKTLFPPWNVGLNVTVENSKNRGELQKIVQPLDKVLRYTIHVEHAVDVHRESTVINVVLFQFCGGSEWKFLGKDEGLYNHAATLPALIRFNVNSPQPGDIFINRLSCREWDAKEQTGGFVEIYKDEPFFDLLKEPRENLQNYRWGIGDDTTIVRFGTFANKEWNWLPKPSVDIFILNSRGSSLRRHSRIPWDDQWRPKANYNFSLYNPKNMQQVPGNFKPTTGDVIIRYTRNPRPSSGLVGDDDDLDQNHVGGPSVQIEFFNALHLVRNGLANGDWLIRVGYERSDKNVSWTHVTAELYQCVMNPDNEWDKFWDFKGRDTYVFGALMWPQKHGLFSGKEQDEPYADPDDDLSQKRHESAIKYKTDQDHSRAVRLFLSSLGIPIEDLPSLGCMLI